MPPVWWQTDRQEQNFSKEEQHTRLTDTAMLSACGLLDSLPCRYSFLFAPRVNFDLPDRQWRDVSSRTCHQPVIAKIWVKNFHMIYAQMAKVAVIRQLPNQVIATLFGM
jgi:hypothetical protein